jgi:PEGA domain
VKPNGDARVVFRGSLGLDSRPQGARVFLNGLDVGRTPIDLRNLEVGSRAVRLELTGYQTWSSVIRVVTDQRSRMTANLRPAPADQAPTLSGNESPVTFDETGIR